MWPFLAALVALNAATFPLRDSRITGTAAILGLNWALCSAAAYGTGEEYPVAYFLTFDYLSAFTLLVLFPLDGRKSTLWEGMVGLLYGGEMIAHAARSLSGSQAAIYYGWYFLKWSAWTQVAVVVIWGLYALACRRGLSVGRLSNLDPLLGGYRSGANEKAR